MTFLNESVYICKEVFDENSEPTKIEIREQAFRLGIDPVKELHLLYIAKQCLLEPLPSNWLPCCIIKENKYFYYNTQSKTSQWEHPLDEHYRQLVEKIRSEDSTGQDISLNIILDEDNSLDTMYHTKNMNHDKRNVAEKRTVRFKTPIEESLGYDNSDDNMKFLGPIKLNTPYTSTTPSILQNLPQFSSTASFDMKNAGRSGLSKYNILPSKDDQLKKSDIAESIRKLNDDVDCNVGKENLKKIDITLTESSDRSESTSSEMHTDNLNTDYEVNGTQEKCYVSPVQTNNRQEIEVNNDKRMSASNHGFNILQSMTGSTQGHNIKKDVSDSGNSTAKDSKIIQSPIVTNSFSGTKSKMAEITQRFPLNKVSTETKLFMTSPEEDNEGTFNVKYNRTVHNFDQEKNSEDEKHALMHDACTKVIIEKHFDSLKNKLEDTIKTKESLFREEFITKIDDTIRELNGKFEKHIESRHNELFEKNELELKKIMQGNTGKSLIEECEKKCIENVSNAEQMYSEKLSTFKKELENFAETLKKQIHLELETMSNELKKELSMNSENVTDSWSRTLELYKNNELDKVKNDFEQTAESIKRDANNELHKFNQEFKEKVKVVSEVKLSDLTDQLDAVLRDEIESFQSRVNRNKDNISNIQPPTHKSNSPKLFIDCSEVEPHLSCQCSSTHKVNYCGNDIRQKIHRYSSELNNALRLVNKMTSTITNHTPAEHCLCSNKCTVSCQTENIVMADSNASTNNFTNPRVTLFNRLYDFNSKQASYWNQSRSSQSACTNHLTPCSHNMFNPLGVLRQEELKVNAAEQNICRLFDSFNTVKPTDVYSIPMNTNNYIHQHKFDNIYQAPTPKQVAHNRTSELKDWLYKTDLKNENKWS